ncbi:iron-sulfur cluster carrier protein ApbC [Motiliproteus sediminis]|uniref:iron-sulfur cluster carrier protein ApbC n=1 Tax=Motiliproteus sediminis TaxID=1468178 RepID=UPI001AEFCD2B|nr:iron-sulfur cluster carrier protein ApbC [Motiliproteus sediminis]
MTDTQRVAVEALLGDTPLPYIDQTLVEAKAVKGIEMQGGTLVLTVQLALPSLTLGAWLRENLEPKLLELDGVSAVQWQLSSKIIAHKTQNNMKSMENVRNIVAVASGKGGVGKSTTTVNLALALAAEGARVGVLDADIYGPSQGLMLGIGQGQRPVTEGSMMRPISAYGVQAMSMSFLIDDNQPMVWRGPMVSGALQQLLTQTGWDDLDYLFVDMPPGTGDIQLTLSQKVPVTGAVIVTTPQDIALLDARKGIEMFRKVEIPVLGVVENMSLHVCSQCGHAEPIFGEGGGQKIAEAYDAELLGQLPLALAIRQQSDSGAPIVAADPASEAACHYRDIALRIAALLAARGKNYANVFPEIVVQND